MSNYEEWSQEELKTFAGLLMLDLRGSWNQNDEYRIESLSEVLHHISYEHIDEDQEVLDLLDLCHECLKEDIPSGCYDGRIFRDEFLYGYHSPEGATERVCEDLNHLMNFPEYHLPEDFDN